MNRLLKAAFYKLSKDWIFRIMMILGAAIATFLALILFGVESIVLSGVADKEHFLCTGEMMFLLSTSPVQNFGIAIPILLIVFTVGEYNHGTIRNKIVVGNSKLKIYFSLLITGLIFMFAVLLTYVGFSTALGCIFGGGFYTNIVHADGTKEVLKNALFAKGYMWKFIVIYVLMYITLTSMTIFFSTLTRSVGGSIPIVIISLLFLSSIPAIFQTFVEEYEWARDGLEKIAQKIAEGTADEWDLLDQQTYQYIYDNFKGIYNFDQALQLLNPFYFTGGSGLTSVVIQGDPLDISIPEFTKGIWSNVLWTAMFVGFGGLIFVKRDIK